MYLCYHSQSDLIKARSATCSRFQGHLESRTRLGLTFIVSVHAGKQIITSSSPSWSGIDQVARPALYHARACARSRAVDRGTGSHQPSRQPPGSSCCLSSLAGVIWPTTPLLMKVLTQSTKRHEKSSIYLANSLLINRFWEFGPPFLFGHRPPLNILVHPFCCRTTSSKSFDSIFHPFNLIKIVYPTFYLYICINSFQWILLSIEIDRSQVVVFDPKKKL
jgi:hypothetical protein